FLPRFARAHTLGLSTASFDVRPDGRVDARLVFAGAEVSATAQNPMLGDLRTFVLEGVEVTADGARCAPTFRGADAIEGDRVALNASYACPPPAATGEIAVTLFYLSALTPGHREIARITAGSATSEAVLSGDRRALVLQLPGAPRRE